MPRVGGSPAYCWRKQTEGHVGNVSKGPLGGTDTPSQWQMAPEGGGELPPTRFLLLLSTPPPPARTQSWQLSGCPSIAALRQGPLSSWFLQDPGPGFLGPHPNMW